MSVRTEEVLDRLAAWRQLGLVTDEQADRIAAHERGRASCASEPTRGDRTTAAEAIGYVGAALVLGAIGLFVGEFWDSLTATGQLALAGLVTVSLAGAATVLRGARSPAMARLTSVLFVGVAAGVAWCATILTDGVLGWREDDVALASSLSAVATAAPLYLLRRRALPQLTLLVAGLTLLGALLIRPDLHLEPFWYALPFAALGTIWVVLGEGRILEPRKTAGISGSIVALVALQCGAFGDLRMVALALAVVAAASLVGAAVTVGGLHHLAVGAIGSFVIVPQLVFEVFGDAIGAPATLLLVGVLLVLLAVGVGRARREVADPVDAP